MKINFKNWCCVTGFKAFKTFIQTFISALAVTGVGIALIDVKTAAWVGLGAALACFAMYFGKLQWEIAKDKFRIYAVLDDEEVTDEKIQKAVDEALSKQSDVKKDLKTKEAKKKVDKDENKKEETKEDSSPSSDKVEQKTGKIYLSPSNQTGNTYTGVDTTEAEQCEKIAKKLKTLLAKKGFEVMIGKRSEDMETRCKASDEFGADLHLPIHTNAYNGTVGGTRAFYFSEDSKAVAQALYNAIYEITPGQSDNLQKKTDLYELHHTEAPAVYMEVEFHDVEAYAKWIAENTVTIAQALCDGICAAFNNCEIKKGVYTEKTAEKEAKAEAKEEAKTAEVNANKGGNCKCSVGGEYVLKEAMKVRTGPGCNYAQKKKSELTTDGQAHALNQENAVLLAGTRVTCLAVDENWIKIPSGWICAKDTDGTVYVEEAPKENSKVQAIRGRLAAWSNPYNQGFAGMCQAWVQTIYHEAGLTSPTYCCASHNRDANAKSGDPSNGEMVFASSSYHNAIDSVCGRHAGHVGIYMDGYVYGSQIPYKRSFSSWKSTYGYGGHTNQGNW